MYHASCTYNYPDEQIHNLYVVTIFYVIHTPTCFDASAFLHVVLSFYFAKVTKLIRVTNSIKSVD